MSPGELPSQYWLVHKNLLIVEKTAYIKKAHSLAFKLIGSDPTPKEKKVIKIIDMNILFETINKIE